MPCAMSAANNGSAICDGVNDISRGYEVEFDGADVTTPSVNRKHPPEGSMPMTAGPNQVAPAGCAPVPVASRIACCAAMIGMGSPKHYGAGERLIPTVDYICNFGGVARVDVPIRICAGVQQLNMVHVAHIHGSGGDSHWCVLRSSRILLYSVFYSPAVEESPEPEPGCYSAPTGPITNDPTDHLAVAMAPVTAPMYSCGRYGPTHLDCCAVMVGGSYRTISGKPTMVFQVARVNSGLLLSAGLSDQTADLTDLGIKLALRIWENHRQEEAYR
jgi:hypothetical protein